MPLNVVSYDTYELGARDAISITFKDMATNQIFVETIDHPKYEVYILKKEYWDRATYMDCWRSVDECDKVLVSYRNRDKELAPLLGLKPDQVKYSTVLFGYDIKIEHYYWIQFLIEYGNDELKPINVGFFDIESDIIQSDGFAAPGEAPTCAVTLVDASARSVYTIVLGKDNLPIVAESNPKYTIYQEVKKKFYEQVDYLKENIDKFISELHDLFDESYGVFDYHLIIVDEEIKLHQLFWEIVRRSNLDFMMAWNAPYDIRNLIERPLVLGYEPESIICDPAYKYRTCFFEEDDNVIVHKRNHRAIISIKPVLLCQMWLYAGIRSGEGKQPTMKLTAIAQKEIGDEKLNYEEEGSIKTFMYKNLWKFIIYNIKDVLLQYGIHRETGDIDSVYDRCYENGMLISEAFVSTTMLTESLTKFFLTEGFVIGTNANKILPPFDYKAYMSDMDTTELEEMDAMAMLNPDDGNDDELADADEGYDDD